MSRMLFEKTQPGGILALVDKTFHPGSDFYVGALATHGGVDGTSYGKDPSKPVATLDYAISLCTNDKHDHIWVLPGHAETITSVVVDVSDVTISGLGNGGNRPTFTLAATDSEVNVTADDVVIEGCRFISTVNDLVIFIDADANDLVIDHCHFETSSGAEAFGFVNFATTKDNFAFTNNTVLQPSDPEGTDNAAGTGCLYWVDSENILVEGNRILGQFETAIIHNLTTKCANFFSRNNIYRQEHSAALIIDIVAASTGHSRDDTGHTPAATDATPALCIGSYDIEWWLSRTSDWSNDSAAGGQGMIASESATS